MKTYEASQRIIIKGTLRYCAEECVKEKARGFEIVKSSAKRQWPYFWRLRYKVTLRKYFMIDENGTIAQVPSSEQLTVFSQNSDKK
jgi:hypothetical protein